MSSPVAHRLSGRRHLAVAGLAGLVSVTILAGVLALFDRAGPTQWLHASPEVLELVSRCDELPGRAARDRCARDVVADLVERARDESRLASR